MADPSFGIGFAGPLNMGSRFSRDWFFVESILNLVRTAAVVQVKAVTPGTAEAIGTVVVLPLVNMVDGNLNAYPHQNLPPIPYSRVQGGTNAIVCDPVVGDIGIAIFCDRDSSNALKQQGQANPGSQRTHDLADGVYLFSCIGAAPTQYVEFTTGGINIADKNGNTIVMNSSGITINGILFNQSQDISGVTNINGSGEVTFNGIELTQHRHTQANDSAGNIEAEVSIPIG